MISMLWMTVSLVCISEYFDWCSEQGVKSGNNGLALFFSYVSTFALIGAILSVVTYS